MTVKLYMLHSIMVYRIKISRLDSKAFEKLAFQSRRSFAEDSVMKLNFVMYI